jgi:hypothetical protein
MEGLVNQYGSIYFYQKKFLGVLCVSIGMSWSENYM